jgi:glycerol-3-phosphate dehydrogenase (NAD(P)+)
MFVANEHVLNSTLETPMRVGLIGKGDRFESLVHLLSDQEVYHWHGAPNGEDGEVELPDHVQAVDAYQFADTPLIFLALPITQLREAAHELGNHISARQALVHTTRNLEFATENTASQILAEETHTQRIGFVSGPFRAHDVLENRASSMVCASAFPEVLDLVSDALDGTNCRVYRSDDLRGAEVSAAYARIIAMLYGCAREMDLGASLEATLFTRGLAEIARFVVYHGGHERTAFGLSGCGNLRSDTAENGSIDHQIGQAFVRRDGITREELRGEFGSVGGSLFDLMSTLAPAAERSGLDTHIIEQAVRVVEGDQSPREALSDLIALPTFHE